MVVSVVVVGLYLYACEIFEPVYTYTFHTRTHSLKLILGKEGACGFVELQRAGPFALDPRSLHDLVVVEGGSLAFKPFQGSSIVLSSQHFKIYI